MSSQAFQYVRASTPEEVPAASPHVIDIALLDMNHHFPNLGHGSIVQTVACIAGMLEPVLTPANLAVRVVSFPVRNNLMVPESTTQWSMILGTGGPGHIVPEKNDGVAEFAQGVKEDPAWEPRFHKLMSAVRADEKRAAVMICHSFGLTCRWLGVAKPTLRGPEKGGKSAGIHENVLTPEALAHPWFSRLASELPDGKHLKIVDSRLFDLIPEQPTFPPGITPIGYETWKDGSASTALTMIEIARDRGGVMPRMFAVNHHPEVYDLELQRELIAEKLARGEVTQQWYEERNRTIGELITPEAAQHLILTSRYTFICPVAFHIFRFVRERREAMGLPGGAHEDQVLAKDFVADRRQHPRGPKIDGYAV